MSLVHAKRLIWDDARVFLAVARTGSLSGASQQLSAGIATISRRIERLETALAIPLFVRHQSGYRLTDDGEDLVEKAEALENAAQSFAAGSGVVGAAAGRVKLATAENLANPVIIPSLPGLFRKHPRLALDVTTDVATVNLHRRDADLAVRMIKPTRGNVTVRRIGTLGFGLYGSDAYLAQRSAKLDGATFDKDCFIGWSEAQSGIGPAQWIERIMRGRAPALTTTTLAGQLSGAQAGLGLAILPHFMGIEAGLTRVPDELGVDQPIWLVIHSDLSSSRRVRVVADHLAALISDQARRLSHGE